MLGMQTADRVGRHGVAYFEGVASWFTEMRMETQLQLRVEERTRKECNEENAGNRRIYKQPRHDLSGSNFQDT